MCAGGESAWLWGRQLQAAVVSAVVVVQEVSGVCGWLLLQVETQALLVGAVCWGGGTGEASCWIQIFQTGNLLPHPREAIHIYKLVLCSVPWKCKLICCFPWGCLACFSYVHTSSFITNYWGEKKTEECKMQSLLNRDVSLDDGAYT